MGALVPANLISSYVPWKAFRFERSPMVTGRAARWRCHMWRSERPAGVTSITTRKKRAEKVVLPEAVECKKRKKKICWRCAFDLHGVSNIMKDLCKTLIPFCGELGVSGALSLFSLPRIKCSSNTCRS